MRNKTFFVTTPIYYVNARPHIGHVYTTIAADVLARHYRAKGFKVLFSTGTDENSQKSIDAAQKEGKDVRQYVDAMAHQWESTFHELGFSFDVFVRTTSTEHQRAVHALMGKIDKSGDIYLGTYKGYYCDGCESFISESELIEGMCVIHKTKLRKISEKNYFFRLTKYREPLLKHFAKHPSFVRPDAAKNKMLHYIEHEMEDISISRQAQEWGLRMPQDPSHAIYVWFDALINYLTVTGYPEDVTHSVWWPANLHIIGKDIIKFHCAIWPAMLLSAGLPLPHQVFAHGFFTVDGQKISKSLGNAIDPLELAKQYPIDAIRYYILRDMPFGNDGDFSHERLKERYNADLAHGLGNLTSRVLTMIEKFIPDFDPDLKPGELPHEVEAYVSSVPHHIESLAFDKALSSIWDTLRWADMLIEEKKPWQLARDGNISEIEHVCTHLVGVLMAAAEQLEPLMPTTSNQLSMLLEARPLKKPAEPLFHTKD